MHINLLEKKVVGILLLVPFLFLSFGFINNSKVEAALDAPKCGTYCPGDDGTISTCQLEWNYNDYDRLSSDGVYHGFQARCYDHHCANPICPKVGEYNNDAQCACNQTATASQCGDKCGIWNDGFYPLCGGDSTCSWVGDGPQCYKGSKNSTFCIPTTATNGYSEAKCTSPQTISYNYVVQPDGSTPIPGVSSVDESNDPSSLTRQMLRASCGKPDNSCNSVCNPTVAGSCTAGLVCDYTHTSDFARCRNPDNPYDSVNCAAAPPADPWLVTYKGNSSANGGYVFPMPTSDYTVPFTTDTGKPFLSTFETLSGTTLIPRLQAASKIDTYALNYNNEAVLPSSTSGFSSWYPLVLDRVKRNGDAILTPAPGDVVVNQSFSSYITTSTGITVAPGDKVVYNVQGSMTVNPGNFCDVKGVILVSGNLTLVPDITNANADSGCLYVVAGTVTIANGAIQNPVIPIYSTTQPYYDQLNAYIITDGGFTTTTNNAGAGNKYQGLYLNGGIISSKTGGLNLHRDLNTSANGTNPAIVIKYDPFYRVTFSKDLAARGYSIREY